MEFGVCLNAVEEFREDPVKLDEQLTKIAAAGFTYIEIVIAACADANNEEISAIQALMQKNKLAAKRANVLFPGGIKVVGPEKNDKVIREYFSGVFPKLKSLGVKLIVFGSGGARNIPDGFSYTIAFRQFCDTARFTAETAAGYGIKAALEHLSPKESNLLTTVKETVKAVREVNHPNCGLNFDIYHADERTNDIYNVIDAKDILFHSHVAKPGSRLYPSPEDRKLLENYFSVLKSAGYNGTVSIEGTLNSEKSFEKNMSDAYEILTGLST